MGDSQENIVMQEIQSSIKASSLHLFQYSMRIKGCVRHIPGISVETCTREFPYEKMTIGDVIG